MMPWLTMRAGVSGPLVPRVNSFVSYVTTSTSLKSFRVATPDLLASALTHRSWPFAPRARSQRQTNPTR